MSDFTLRLNSTNLVELKDFIDVDGTRPTTAVVTATYTDSTGTPVTGASAISMPWVASRRRYRGVLPSTVSWVSGATYTETVTATVGSDVRTFVKVGTAAA